MIKPYGFVGVFLLFFILFSRKKLPTFCAVLKLLCFNHFPLREIWSIVHHASSVPDGDFKLKYLESRSNQNVYRLRLSDTLIVFGV